MFCTQCGREIPRGQGACGACGEPAVIPVKRGALAPADPSGIPLAEAPSASVGPGRPPLLTVLAVWQFLQAALLLVSLCGLTLFVPTIDSPRILPIIAAFGILGVLSGLAVAGGIGLLGLRGYGRRIRQVFACLELLLFPLGTVLSVLQLLYLRRPDIRALFTSSAGSREVLPVQARTLRTVAADRDRVNPPEEKPVAQDAPSKKEAPLPAAALPEGECPQCRKAHPAGAVFCKGCGAGLSEKCPKCGVEDHAPIQFCQQCGCDAPKERKLRTLLADGQRLAQAFQFEPAAAALEAALGVHSESKEAKALLGEVREKGSRLAAALARMEEAIQKEDFEGAAARADEALGMVPGQARATEVRGQIGDLLRHQKARLAMSQAREACERKDLAGALVLAAAAAEVDAGAVQLQKELQEREGRYRSVVQKARIHFNHKRYEEALQTLGPVLEEWPYPDAQELKASVEMVLRRIEPKVSYAHAKLAKGDLAGGVEDLSFAVRLGAPVEAELDEARRALARRRLRKFLVAANVVSILVAGGALWVWRSNLSALARGEGLVKEGKFGEGSAQLEKVGEFLGEYARSRELMALCDRARKAQELEAKGLWRNALDAWTSIPELPAHRDHCRRELEARYSESMATARRALDKGQWAAAQQAVSDALELKLLDAAALEVGHQFRRKQSVFASAMQSGERYASSGDWSGEVDSYQLAVTLSPDDEEATLGLRLALAKVKKIDVVLDSAARRAVEQTGTLPGGGEKGIYLNTRTFTAEWTAMARDVLNASMNLPDDEEMLKTLATKLASVQAFLLKEQDKWASMKVVAEDLLRDFYKTTPDAVLATDSMVVKILSTLQAASDRIQAKLK